MSLRLRLARDPVWQARLARFPLTRWAVRREGAALFDLVSGFVQSQALAALVELGALERLEAWRGAGEALPDVPEARAEILLRAGVAMGLLRMRRGRFRLSQRGAALLGVPGLTEMIRHHRVLYGDLRDPAAFFRGKTEPELASFWPYVLGGGDEETAARYSRLMAESQRPVAEEVLAAVDFRGIRRLMDVGGGTGAFAGHVVARHPGIEAVVADLPEVIAGADFPRGVSGIGADFRAENLPGGADAVSLVRVLYDHSDETVRDLLSRVRDALPSGGRVVVAEPMSGGKAPTRAGDVYFAIYCLAMGTGQVRSASQIVTLLQAAGFVEARECRTDRPFVTGVVEARRP